MANNQNLVLKFLITQGNENIFLSPMNSSFALMLDEVFTSITTLVHYIDT